MNSGFNIYDVYEGTEPYIFISYAHNDSHIVLPIIQNLQEQGFRVWYDEGIELGAEWPEYIAEHLMACSCFLAFVSQSALESVNCRQEINLAINHNKNPVAIYLEEVKLTPGMEMRLGSIKAMFYTRFSSVDGFLKKLGSAKLLQPCKAPKGIHPSATLVKNGSVITRDTVRTVTFVDSLAHYPQTHWDVSESWGSKTYCWAYENNELYDVFLAAEGGVIAPSNSRNLFKNCSKLNRIDFSGFDTSQLNNTAFMFYGCSALESIDVSNWDMSKVTNIKSMFRNCSALRKVDVSKWDTSNVTNMNSTFYNCTALTELDLNGWNTSKVTDMNSTFRNCTSLTALDLSSFDTSKVTTMYSMFYSSTGLQSINLKNWDTSSVTDMVWMFGKCENLTELDLSGFNTSNVTNMYAMFHGCKKLPALDVSGFDTSSVTDISWMFSQCRCLTELNVSGFDTSQVTNCSAMFMNCKALSKLDVSGFNTHNVTELNLMFKNCINLPAPDVSKWELSSVTNYEYFMDDNVLINGAPWMALFA